MSDVLLQPGSPPNDAAMPDSPARLVNFIAAYLRVTGLETLEGVIIDTSEPAPEDRDKLWVKVDAATNRPIGTYAFRGEWLRLPVIPGYGTSDERPGNPQPGEQYWDSDINCLIVYERGQWRTASGSPGDVKHVQAASLAVALERNPGWSELADARGRVIVGAGAGGGLTERTVGDQWGVEEVTLTLAQIPAHSHDLSIPAGENAGTGSVFDVCPPSSLEARVYTTTVQGEGQAHDNCQPSLALFTLIKD